MQRYKKGVSDNSCKACRELDIGYYLNYFCLLESCCVYEYVIHNSPLGFGRRSDGVTMSTELIDFTVEQLRLKSWLGCGTTLLGRRSLNGKKHFREEIIKESFSPLDNNDTSEVQYKFFTLLFLPIFPLGCYRVQWLYRKEGFSDLVYCKVQKKEKPLFKEIVLIYIGYYFVIAFLLLWLVYFASSE